MQVPGSPVHCQIEAVEVSALQLTQFPVGVVAPLGREPGRPVPTAFGIAVVKSLYSAHVANPAAVTSAAAAPTGAAPQLAVVVDVTVIATAWYCGEFVTLDAVVVALTQAV